MSPWPTDPTSTPYQPQKPLRVIDIGPHLLEEIALQIPSFKDLHSFAKSHSSIHNIFTVDHRTWRNRLHTLGFTVPSLLAKLGVKPIHVLFALRRHQESCSRLARDGNMDVGYGEDDWDEEEPGGFLPYTTSTLSDMYNEKEWCWGTKASPGMIFATEVKKVGREKRAAAPMTDRMDTRMLWLMQQVSNSLLPHLQHSPPTFSYTSHFPSICYLLSPSEAKDITIEIKVQGANTPIKLLFDVTMEDLMPKVTVNGMRKDVQAEVGNSKVEVVKSGKEREEVEVKEFVTMKEKEVVKEDPAEGLEMKGFAMLDYCVGFWEWFQQDFVQADIDRNPKVLNEYCLEKNRYVYLKDVMDLSGEATLYPIIDTKRPGSIVVQLGTHDIEYRTDSGDEEVGYDGPGPKWGFLDRDDPQEMMDEDEWM